jgi:wyosine [tRNA(Phe)-imidazoG37] synthetase (radical SAM superfamily)
MKYIYGPVKSRRLRVSLGISLMPYKICDFDCIYCQLGKTNCLTVTRKKYIGTDDILEELRAWLGNNSQEAEGLNYITISGLGEPTLNSKVGEVITGIKKIAPCPVAVITNASLLNNTDVRRELLAADLIVPSLDTVVVKVFRQIDRPHRDITLDEIIDGLVSLRKEFRGKIWLEAMIVKGVNDDLGQIRKLKEAVDIINPDKVQINSPVRTTADENVLPADKRKLKKIKEILGDKCEII